MSSEDNRSGPESEGEGDDLVSRDGRILDPEDTEDEEQLDEEMNEEDRRFIADDEEEEEVEEEGAREKDGGREIEDEHGVVPRKRRKRRKRIPEEEEDLDEDLELVAENTGQVFRREFKRLKQGRAGEGRSVPDDDLSHMFDDVEGGGAGGYQDDDLDDFIEDDEIDLEPKRPANRAPAARMPRRRELRDNEEAYDEVFDIFGNGEEYAFALQQPAQEERPVTKLEDVFEPAELAEKMLTDEDDLVRSTDLPERYQMEIGFTVEQLSDRQLEDEVAWMILRTDELGVRHASTAALHRALKDVLSLMIRDSLEVPYIRMHCQDQFTEYHRENHHRNTTFIIAGSQLWDVYDLHLQFRSLDSRRRALRKLYDKVAIDDPHFTKSLGAASSTDEMEDWSDYLQLHYSEQIMSHNKQAGRKRPSQMTKFDVVKKTRVFEFTKLFGLPVMDLGENVDRDRRVNIVKDHERMPLDLAASYTTGLFRSPEMVLKVAKAALAQEIGYDPRMRAAFRRAYNRMASVNVYPTDKGSAVIDTHHPYYAFKFLRNKPISRFTDGQVLDILKSEAEGLTTMQVVLEGEQKFFDHVRRMYQSDGNSILSEAWNRQRRDVINDAISDYLRPIAEAYVKKQLRMEAEKRVARAAQMSLELKLNVAPFRTREMEPEAVPRVLTMTWGSGERHKDAVNMVVMLQDGRVRASLKVNNLRAPEHVAQFIELAETWKPNVIAVAGLHSVANRRLLEHTNAAVAEGKAKRSLSFDPKIIVVNDEAARLYYNSKRAAEEYPSMSPLMRYCVSLARRLQSPIHEYAALGRDIIHVKHHPQQHLIPEEMLMKYLQRALVNVTNQIGVDVNEAVRDNYKSHTLQYVCGLGPRKALALLNKLRTSNGSAELRTEFASNKLMGKSVFMNCASFLRIRPWVQILDDTRIHPTDYNLARRIAAGAMDVDPDDLDDDAMSRLVLRLTKGEEAEKLDSLDLDAYADRLEKETGSRKRMLLIHIRHELRAPYKDPRLAYPEPTVDETFGLVTGETDRTLRPGAMVPVVITKVRDRSASARLDNGLDGFIPIQKMSDRPVDRASDVLQVGQTIHCQIVNVDKAKYLIELSCKPSEVHASDPISMTQRDKYFDEFAEEQMMNAEAAKRRNEAVKMRVIQHPAFRSMNSKEAEDYLSNRPRGEFVVRPSSKGTDHITVTWKVDQDMYQHIDVQELDKEDEVSLGRILRVGKMSYDDLDELIALHVESISRKFDEMRMHPKFRPGGIQEMYKFLEATSLANPRMAVYGLCINSDVPGTINLAFKLNAQRSPQRWVIGVMPDSYKLGDEEFPDVSSLIAGFKRMQTQ